MLYYRLIAKKILKFKHIYFSLLSVLLLINNVRATYYDVANNNNLTSQTSHMAFWYQIKSFNLILFDGINNSVSYPIVRFYEFGLDYPLVKNTLISASCFRSFSNKSNINNYYTNSSEDKKPYGFSTYFNYMTKSVFSSCGCSLVCFDNLSLITSEGSIGSNLYLISNLYLCGQAHFNVAQLITKKASKDSFNFWRLTPKVGLGIDFNLKDNISITPKITLGYGLSNTKYNKKDTNTNYILFEISLDTILADLMLSINWQLIKLQHYNPDNLVSIAHAKIGFKL
jgi:hypothetical protein